MEHFALYSTTITEYNYFMIISRYIVEVTRVHYNNTTDLTTSATLKVTATTQRKNPESIRRDIKLMTTLVTFVTSVTLEITAITTQREP